MIDASSERYQISKKSGSLSLTFFRQSDRLDKSVLTVQPIIKTFARDAVDSVTDLEPSEFFFLQKFVNAFATNAKDGLQIHDGMRSRAAQVSRTSAFLEKPLLSGNLLLKDAQI